MSRRSRAAQPTIEPLPEPGPWCDPVNDPEGAYMRIHAYVVALRAWEQRTGRTAPEDATNAALPYNR